MPDERTATSGIGERVWSTAFESSPDCVKLIDLDGRLLRINGSGCEAFGMCHRNTSDLSGENIEWLDLLPPEVRPPGEAALAEAAAGRSVRFPGKSIDPDGGLRYWDNMLIPGTGQDRGFIVVISRDVTDHHQTAEDLRVASEVDDLTGLLNRRALLAAVDAQLNHARLTRALVGVLFLDLDDLKHVNDRFGHTAGDAALQAVARGIRAVLPADTGAAGRWGGDEFVVAVADLDDPATLTEFAQRLQVAVAGPLRFGSHELDLSPSVTVGGALFDGARPDAVADDAQRMVSLADWEMVAEKRQRKGGLRVRPSTSPAVSD